MFFNDIFNKISKLVNNKEIESKIEDIRKEAINSNDSIYYIISDGKRIVEDKVYENFEEANCRLNEIKNNFSITFSDSLSIKKIIIFDTDINFY